MPRRPSDLKPRLIIGIAGLPKTGKTHFALTCPEPILFLNTDYSVDEVLPKFPNLDIEIEDIPVYDPGNFESGQAALALFHERYVEYLARADSAGGTVVIDSGTFLWQLVQVVKLEEARRERFRKQSKVKEYEDLKEQRFDYGPVNLYMDTLLRRAFHYPAANMVVTHKVQPKYNERGEETAELKVQGFNQTSYIMQAMLRTLKDETGFGAMVEMARHDPEQEGIVIPNPSYSDVRLMLLGG